MAMSSGCSVVCRPRGENLLGAGHAHPGTQLQAGRQFAVLAGLAAGLTADLVQQVLEFGAVTLETGGGNVGQVVEMVVRFMSWRTNRSC